MTNSNPTSLILKTIQNSFTLIQRMQFYLLQNTKFLEQVPPAPGNARGQHDAMVNQGLCQIACQNPKKNRYCNLFPFDEHIVELEDPNQYINASWVTLLPWHPH